MRKLFLGLVAAGLTFGSLLFAAPARAEYIDQDQIGTWSADYVEILTQLDILVGYPDGSFRPNENLTREEYAVSLTKALIMLEDSLLNTQFETDWYLYQEIVALQTQLLEVLYQVDALAAKDLVEKNNFVAISIAYNPETEATDDEAYISLEGRVQIISISDTFSIAVRPFVNTTGEAGGAVTLDTGLTDRLTVGIGAGAAGSWSDTSALAGDEDVVGYGQVNVDYSVSDNTVIVLTGKVPFTGDNSGDINVSAGFGIKF